MKKVTVLRLSGCSYCEELVEKLDKENIEYTSLDANKNGALADEVEELLDTDLYPITILEIEGLSPFFLFRAETYDEVGEAVVGNAVKVGVSSIDSMVYTLLKLI